MIFRIPESYDSRFRFVLVAAERARQLQSGASPRVHVRSTKPSHIAIREAEADLIDFDVLVEEGHPDERAA